ncbi:MAG: hypothetical protein IKB82_02505 [Clostridia bacterium]|nr:hypothetical protein [Clostridia bacterium]
MPLIVCAIFFIVLFSCEGFWFQAARDHERKTLRRYQETEHPRRKRSDFYLDMDWN